MMTCYENNMNTINMHLRIFKFIHDIHGLKLQTCAHKVTNEERTLHG